MKKSLALSILSKKQKISSNILLHRLHQVLIVLLWVKRGFLIWIIWSAAAIFCRQIDIFRFEESTRFLVVLSFDIQFQLIHSMVMRFEGAPRSRIIQMIVFIWKNKSPFCEWFLKRTKYIFFIRINLNSNDACFSTFYISNRYTPFVPLFRYGHEYDPLYGWKPQKGV